MPSAANVKLDKQINAESSLAESNSTSPLRQAITIIEHKIRNLEKRKSKLESYRELQNSGKELNSDQKTAIAKYDEVLQTLDFARDLCKQFIGIAACTEKEIKKVAKKEAQLKTQAELARLREILLVQDALNQMGNESVREDFLQGRNGAAQLSEADLKLLDDLYPAVTPKHEAGNPTAFTNEVQAAAEHLLAVVDGKPKEVFGGTYSQVKEILGKIHESGYFDQAQDFGEIAGEEEQVLTETLEHTNLESCKPPMAPQVESLPENTLMNPPMHAPVEQPPQTENQNLTPAEPIFYQPQQPPSQVQIQQLIRPINEVMEMGSFLFLQESEIDTPLDQIPTQTFTNQSYVGNPPPPIPLPPHFQNIGNNMPPLQQQAPVQPQLQGNNIDNNNINVMNQSKLKERSLNPPINDMGLINERNTSNQQMNSERNMVKNIMTVINDSADAINSGLENLNMRAPVNSNNSYFQAMPNNNGNYNRPRQNHQQPNHQRNNMTRTQGGNSNRRHN